MSPSVSTGRARIGRFTMVVGQPAGTIVTVAEGAAPQPPPELVEALQAAPAPPAAKLQEAVEDVGEVTSKIERAVELFTLVARGDLSAEAVSKEIDALLDLLRRLDRTGRFEEALRLARPLQGLLALTLRWVSLVEALRTALHAAEVLADSEAIGWVRHELGSLGLGAEDAHAAASELTRARELRARSGDSAGLRATEHNLATLRTAFSTGGGGNGRWSTRTLAIVGATVLALVVIGFALTPALDDGTNTDTPPTRTTAPTTTTISTQTTTSPSQPADVVAPQVRITAPQPGQALTSEQVMIAGTAGNARGDQESVQLTVYERSLDGKQVLDVAVPRRGTDWSYPAPLPAGEIEPTAYVAVATQRDEAGNESKREPVTFTVEPPSPASPPPPAPPPIAG